MPSTILALAQDAATEASLEEPISAGLFGGYDEGDSTPGKMRRALTRTVKALAADWDWQVLHVPRTFTSLAQETQTGMIPSDFLRFVPDTFWDRTARLRLNGPTSPSDWNTLKSWQTGAVTPHFRQVGNNILTYPVPVSGRTFAFEYITSNVGLDASGTAIARFTADTDTTWWDDELIITGTVMHLRMIERRDSTIEQAQFQKLKADRIKQDGGRRVINMRGASPMSADARLAAMRSNAVIVDSNQWGGAEW